MATIIFPAWNEKMYGNPRLGGVLISPMDIVCSVVEQSNTNCRNCGSGHIREKRGSVYICSYCGTTQ